MASRQHALQRLKGQARTHKAAHAHQTYGLAPLCVFLQVLDAGTKNVDG